MKSWGATRTWSVACFVLPFHIRTICLQSGGNETLVWPPLKSQISLQVPRTLLKREQPSFPCVALLPRRMSAKHGTTVSGSEGCFMARGIRYGLFSQSNACNAGGRCTRPYGSVPGTRRPPRAKRPVWKRRFCLVNCLAVNSSISSSFLRAPPPRPHHTQGCRSRTRGTHETGQDPSPLAPAFASKASHLGFCMSSAFSLGNCSSKGKFLFEVNFWVRMICFAQMVLHLNKRKPSRGCRRKCFVFLRQQRKLLRNNNNNNKPKKRKPPTFFFKLRGNPRIHPYYNEQEPCNTGDVRGCGDSVAGGECEDTGRTLALSSCGRGAIEWENPSTDCWAHSKCSKIPPVVMTLKTPGRILRNPVFYRLSCLPTTKEAEVLNATVRERGLIWKQFSLSVIKLSTMSSWGWALIQYLAGELKKKENVGTRTCRRCRGRTAGLLPQPRNCWKLGERPGADPVRPAWLSWVFTRWLLGSRRVR